MLKLAVLRKVLGRARLERLLKGKWIEPIGAEGRHRLFAERDVHAALHRLERGSELDGYARPIPTPALREKRSGNPLESLAIDLDELHRFLGEPETKTPLNLD